MAQMTGEGDRKPNLFVSSLLLTLTVAVLAYAAGALLPRFGAWSTWTWGSPWSQACVALAALWAGVAVASLIVARMRDAENETVARDIDEARRYAKSLIADLDAHMANPSAREWSFDDEPRSPA